MAAVIKGIQLKHSRVCSQRLFSSLCSTTRSRAQIAAKLAPVCHRHGSQGLTRAGGILRRFEGLKAVVAGATGGVGKAIVQRLVREGVPVTALARDVRDAVRRCCSTARSQP